MSIEVNEVQTVDGFIQDLTEINPDNVTERTAAVELASNIINDITGVNDKLVAEQYRLNSNMNEINKVLEEAQVDSSYVMSLLKATSIVTANLLSTPDMVDSDRVSAIFGMQVSVAVLLRQKLSHLDDDAVVPTLAAVSNLLTLLEVPNETEVEDTTPSV